MTNCILGNVSTLRLVLLMYFEIELSPSPQSHMYMCCGVCVGGAAKYTGLKYISDAHEGAMCHAL